MNILLPVYECRGTGNTVTLFILKLLENCKQLAADDRVDTHTHKKRI